VMTRMFAPFAREIHIAFDTSKKYFRGSPNLLLTGSPIRRMEKAKREEALKFFGLSIERRALLVTGGSLGAMKLNSSILEIADELINHGYQLIWQTGSFDYERVMESCQKGTRESQNIKIEKFIERMDLAYSAADIAVCRAGATTVAELIYFNLPALIVPYPFAAANHQVENAKALVDSGAAIMVVESEMKDRFRNELFGLIEYPDRIEKMRDKMKSLQHPDAAGVIAESILKIARANA